MTVPPMPAETLAFDITPPDSDLLCWCEKVTYESFRQAVWAAPDEQFYDLCRSVGVGTKCTSCLLDAEATFDEAVRRPASKVRAADMRRQIARRSAKRIFYDWLDAWSPRVATPLRGVVPILVGDGVSTVVSVANSVPRALGARSPRFSVRMEVRDEQGRKIGAAAKMLEPGERLDHEISNWTDRSGLITGSCRILTKAIGDGYRGSIRPHFTIRTPHSLSTVHSQGNGRRSAFVRTALHADGETQYLSVVNCEDAPTSVQIGLVDDGTQIQASDASLAPFGATLIALGSSGNPAKPVIAQLKSDRRVRTHIVVAAGRPPRISLHHI